MIIIETPPPPLNSAEILVTNNHVKVRPKTPSQEMPPTGKPLEIYISTPDPTIEEESATPSTSKDHNPFRIYHPPPYLSTPKIKIPKSK